MANQTPEKWFLTPEERAQARSEGLDAYLAEKLGVAANKVQIISAKNEHHETPDGLIGSMVVRVDWHSADDHWHMSNLRFNGELPEGMTDIPDEFVALLGSFAMGRDAQYHNITHDMYGLPLSRGGQVEPASVVPDDTEASDTVNPVLATV